MPYITQAARDEIAKGTDPRNAGELNYCLTRECLDYLDRKGVNYQHINEVIGVLECMKLEMYRRIAASYEALKIKQNGDVY